MDTSKPPLVDGDAISSFRDHGYWIGPQVLDADRLDACRDAMDRVFAGEFRAGTGPHAMGPEVPGKFRRAVNSWWADPVLADLARDPAIGAIAAALIEAGAVRLWEDQLLFKPGPDTGATNVGWHQDWYYWGGSCSVPSMLTAWVAFDDVDERNGAMQVVPGSHTWGLLEGSDFFGQDRDAQMAAIGREADVVTCAMKAGQVSFHHCLTLHGSGPNRTQRPRRSLAIHLMAADVVSRDADRAEPGRPPLEHHNMALLRAQGSGPGDPWNGRWWPVVHPS